MSNEEEFTTLLSDKLKDNAIDDDVLSSYISSIITSDDPDSEKKETVENLLRGYSEDVNAEQLYHDIIDMWSELHQKSLTDKEKEESFDIDNKVALIMEKQAQSVLKTVNRSSEEEKLREAILTRCTFSSEDEEECSDDGAVSSSKPPTQNQNSEAVLQSEKEKRDQMKAEAEKRKAQDKINREKQKSKQEERREKERKRTQKREHRR